MSLRDKIDGVLIDHDENGFHLILSGEEREYNFLLDEKMAQELQAAVAMEISHWPVEKGMMERGIIPRPGPQYNGLHESAGYDLTDPKHPMYHDTMSEVWDSREGK